MTSQIDSVYGCQSVSAVAKRAVCGMARGRPRMVRGRLRMAVSLIEIVYGWRETRKRCTIVHQNSSEAASPGCLLIAFPGLKDGDMFIAILSQTRRVNMSQ